MKKYLLALFMIVFLLTAGVFVGCATEADPAVEPEEEKEEEREEEEEEEIDLEGKIIGIASLPPGSVNNVIAESIAATITEHTPMTARVEPSGGPAVWLGDLERGEIEFGLAGDFDAWAAYEGDERYYDRAFTDQRLVKLGQNVMRASIIVPEDSPVETIEDLAGKRVPMDAPAHPLLEVGTRFLIAGAGLDPDEVEPIRMESYADGVQAVIEGRADASIGTFGSGPIEELDATIGARYLSADTSEEGLERARELFPGIDYDVIEPGPTGVKEETGFYAWSLSLVADKNLPDVIVEEVARALYENYELFKDDHAAMENFKPEHSVGPLMILPVHDAAMEYYKEQNIWSDEIDKRHNEMLN